MKLSGKPRWQQEACLCKVYSLSHGLIYKETQHFVLYNRGHKKMIHPIISLVTILDVLCVIRPIINKGHALTEYVAALKPWVHFISPFSEYLQLMKRLLWVFITSGWSSSTWWIGLKVQFEFRITLMIYWLSPYSLSKLFNNYQIDCHG